MKNLSFLSSRLVCFWVFGLLEHLRTLGITVKFVKTSIKLNFGLDISVINDKTVLIN
ncbi:hypothetical protein LCGC14_1026580 [marine sediment metagenome]|uniref:Uncharacterized protein n=1 Tax=marine sediment metagenome TaxID=412755 RepID=A0A0F9QDZ1_9ZZZZ